MNVWICLFCANATYFNFSSRNFHVLIASDKNGLAAHIKRWNQKGKLFRKPLPDCICEMLLGTPSINTTSSTDSNSENEMVKTIKTFLKVSIHRRLDQTDAINVTQNERRNNKEKRGIFVCSLRLTRNQGM